MTGLAIVWLATAAMMAGLHDARQGAGAAIAAVPDAPRR